MAFVTPVVEHWLEREIWCNKDRTLNPTEDWLCFLNNHSATNGADVRTGCVLNTRVQI